MTSIEDAVKSIHHIPPQTVPTPLPNVSPPTPPPVKKEEEEEEEEDKKPILSTPTKKQPNQIRPDEHTHTPSSVKKKSSQAQGRQIQPEVHELLATIPDTQRDDGTFGLYWKHRLIGGMPFKLTENGLQVTTGRNEVKNIKINHTDTWKLLLYQNPEDKPGLILRANGQDTPAVQEYRKIVHDLDLINIVERSKNPRKKANYQKRKKFTSFLSENVKGSGLLFSYKKPSTFPDSRYQKSGEGLKSGFFPPNTVIIPSENKDLLIKLATSLSERDAGNTSLENLIVALAREARRRKILSKSTFKRVKSLNVMYA